MKASQFKSMIQTIVAEELRKQLPGIIERVLTERYLRGLVLEGAPRRGPKASHQASLSEVLDDEETTPEPLSNIDKGIYQEHPFQKKESKLMSKTNPLSFIYEGVQPIGEREEASDVGLPLDKVGQSMGMDFEKMRKIAFGSKAPPPPPSESAPVRHRPEWDRFVDTRPLEQRESQPAPAQAQHRIPERVAASFARQQHPLFEGDVFPDRPIVLEE